MSYLYYSGLSNKYVYSFLGKNMAGYWLIDWKKNSKLPMFSKYVQFSEFFQNFLLYAIISSCVLFRISCPAIISYILVSTKFYFQKIESLWTKLIFTTLFLPLSLSNLNATYLKLLQKWYKYWWNLNCPSYPKQPKQTCFIKRTDRRSLLKDFESNTLSFCCHFCTQQVTNARIWHWYTF